MNVLELRGIRRTFAKGEEVLRGIDLNLERGEVVGLLGRNGAGKTTLIQVIMGLLHAQAGQVKLFGQVLDDDPVAIKRRIGYVPEDQVLPGYLRVVDVLELHRSLFPTWDHDLESSLLERFQVHLKKRVQRLSKGQARQLAVLCAVAHRPELLILDEPAGGLDPASRREFLEVAIQALQENESTILFSSHHMADVERIAGRTVLIHDGRTLLDSDLDELREQVCLAVLPIDESKSAQTKSSQAGAAIKELRSLRSCLGARKHSGQLRAVFRSDPDETKATLQKAGHRNYSAHSVHCAPVNLEDLFIEIVEGQFK